VKPSGSNRRRVAARAGLIGGGVIALLLIAQLVLPPIAAHVIRDRLGGSSTVSELSIRAVPAIELLWGHADELHVHVSTYSTNLATVSKRLVETHGVNEMHVTIDRVRTGRLKLRHVSLRKRDGLLFGQAIIDRAHLASALPRGVVARGVTPTGALELETTGIPQRTLLVTVQKGRVYAEPQTLLGSLFASTIFDDRHVHIVALRFQNASATAFRVQATARIS
jgi:hypothetical protein